jgi:hypothetical protein
MNGLKKGAVAGALVVSFAGGAAATAWLIGSPASAAPSPAPSSSSGSATDPGRVFHPNEDATHEKGESAAREAQEDAGQFPTVP